MGRCKCSPRYHKQNWLRKNTTFGHGPILDTTSRGRTRLQIYGKAIGTNNPADLFTTYLEERTNIQHTRGLGFEGVEGRLEDAPNLHSISMDGYQTGNSHREWEWLQYIMCGNSECGSQKVSREYKRGAYILSNVIPRHEPTAAGALRVQLGGYASSLGFDPNFPAKCWRVVWNWVETRGDHAPEGATFEGRHDSAAAWNEHIHGP